MQDVAGQRLGGRGERGEREKGGERNRDTQNCNRLPIFQSHLKCPECGAVK